MTEDRQVQAGWYPDPLGLPQLRWWDGQAWAEHTSDARRPLVARGATRLDYAEPADETAEQAEPAATTPDAPVAESASVVPPRETPAAFAPAGPAALPAGTGTAAPLGWAGAALTLHSMRASNVPTVLELAIAGHPTIVVDTRHNAYSWQLELDRFPENPAEVRVAVQIVEPLGRPAFELPGKPLDGLLWRIGNAAFPDRLAPWLRAGERYRLVRWPDASALGTDQLRQAATLANAAFTIEQLAAFTGRSPEPTRSLVNALSLMGTLEITA